MVSYVMMGTGDARLVDLVVSRVVVEDGIVLIHNVGDTIVDKS